MSSKAEDKKLNATIFHEGFVVLVREMDDSRHYAEIADYLLHKINTSEHVKNGKNFFLVPGINYLVRNIGFSSTVIKKSLQYLEKHGWIIVDKQKCSDGVVRSIIFSTEKLTSLMAEIEELKKQKNFTAF
ncbi:hypothetical protein L3V83_13505 [Thiotrichales bacterium 19X7-9]|nr:hypothetical protein [Thiotrichales bacterium 19X7-9]